jgi:hypothetical protein
MTCHGWRHHFKLAAATLLAALVLPASAHAWDSPLAPVTPAVDRTQPHGLGLALETGPASAGTLSVPTDLPASADLTPFAVPPGDQGQVNSCAAWATDYSAMGYYMNKQGLSGGPLAPMYTYSQVTHGQNVGTTLASHMDIAQAQGVDTQADYTQGNYNYTQLPSAAQKANAAGYRISGYETLTTAAKPGTTATETAIKSALADGKPVIVALPVYTNFYSVTAADHGLYSAVSGTLEGYHAVTALGYDATGVRIENQWGAYWGDGGWATLSWSFVNQYVLETRAVLPIVQVGAAPPKVTVAPAVSGPTVYGNTLTATAGTYTNAPTTFTYQWLRDASVIPGATSNTYTTTAADVTHRIRVVVTAANAAGTATGTSASFGPIMPKLPANTTAPALSGTPKRGETLTVNGGGWTESPTTYSYHWQRDKGTGYTNISGATQTGYTLVVSDLQAHIRVLVTARNATGTSPAAAVSNVVGTVAGAPPVNTGPPQISGSATRGSRLVADAGDWSGAGNTYKYQWQRFINNTWTTIAGATAATYTVPQGDEGFELRVAVTATNYDGVATATSDPTDVVAGAPPVNKTVPAPTGTTVRGSQLLAAPGTWDGVGNTYKYQWQRDTGSGFAVIPGAITSAYTLTPADTGANIRFQVTATNVDGIATVLSDVVGPVAAAAPANTTAPVVIGTPARAATLTSSTGVWSGTSNVYSYQWQRDTGSGWTDIAGATKSSYLVQKADEGATLRLQVTATNPDGVLAVTSDPTAPIAAAPPVNTGAPAINGNAFQRTRPVTATQGSWTGPGNVYSYQWQRDTGSGFADIAGATTNLYVLTDADVGARIRVKVTATNPDAAVDAFSAASGAIGLAAPIENGAPVATGTAKTGSTLTTSSGIWQPSGATYAYQWQVDHGSGFEDIPGATAATYTLTDDEAGAKVRAQVTASNQDGSGVGYSQAVGPILASPVNVAAPVVTGTLEDAAVLSATTGDWESAGGLTHTYRYQWVRCAASATTVTIACLPITGATKTTYTTVTQDINARLAVRVTALNSLGVSTVAASDPTGVIVGRELTNTVLPAIRGTAAVREKLTVTAGEWSVPLTRVSYQWRRCTADGLTCTDIPGATANNYVVAVADTDKILAVKVNAASPSWTLSVDSEPTQPVQPLPIPSTSVNVAVLGLPARGQMLRTTMPAWDGYPSTYAYEWQRCDADGQGCQVIPGVRGNSYVLTKADEDFTIRVRLSATNTSGTGEVLSDPTGVVAAVPPTPTAAPSINGNVISGQTLTGSRGAWTTSADTIYTYAWHRCAADGSACAPIPGAVLGNYRLQMDDVGATVRLVITATNPDGVATSSSAPTAPIKPAPPAAYPMPALSGVAQVGKTVSASTGTWTGIGEPVKTTFWRCTTACSAIQTGTDRTYTLTTADAGYKIRASVTGVGAGGSTTVYATAILGPVKSATVGAVLASASRTAVKNASGAVLAKVAAKTPAAGGTATVTVTDAKKGYRAWACPTRDTTCTKPVKLGRKATRIRVAVEAGEKISVVVAKK